MTAPINSLPPRPLAWGTHSLEVAGPGQEDLREGHVRLKDGGLQHPHDQHLGVEDTGTGRKGTLEESGEKRECDLQVARDRPGPEFCTIPGALYHPPAFQASGLREAGGQPGTSPPGLGGRC